LQTFEGTLAFVGGSIFGCSLLLLWMMAHTAGGADQWVNPEVGFFMALASIVGALVETLPTGQVSCDNILIPLSTYALHKYLTLW
jgi:hypothetical protein